MSFFPTLLASIFNLAGPDFFIIFTLFVVSTLFVIWMVVDCALNESSENNLKLVWMLVILFAPLGSLIYFFVRKLSRSSTSRFSP